ncbi:nucleotide exchange factor GrpE [Candidatus Microgenomates bacterium]|nr:nucleotide exchange factor GrpE [Candidatus Microgenomates bacterium]
MKKKIKTDNQNMAGQVSEKPENDTVELKNQLARVLADYDNLRKRHDLERLEIYKLTSIGIVSKFLPILDNLREAQVHSKDSGIAIILGEFEQILKDEDFVEIVANVGDEFDHDDHEAVEVEKTNKKENNGKVSEMVLSGWKMKDGPVVRHTKVKVYKLEDK